MTPLDCLLSRRSIRHYTPQPVSPEMERALLDVFFRSPSAADARPWHLLVLDDRDLLRTLADRMPHCEMLREAALGLAVIADPALEKIPGFWAQDCSAATENLLIAVHGLGLGGVWIGLHPVPGREEAMRDLLSIPPGKIPFSLVALGHPAETLPPENRFDPSRIHRNHW